MIINKVTTLRAPSILTDELIQSHIDEQNTEGFYLIAVVDLIGWYRFFWAKEVQ